MKLRKIVQHMFSNLSIIVGIWLFDYCLFQDMDFQWQLLVGDLMIDREGAWDKRGDRCDCINVCPYVNSWLEQLNITPSQVLVGRLPETHLGICAFRLAVPFCYQVAHAFLCRALRPLPPLLFISDLLGS